MIIRASEHVLFIIVNEAAVGITRAARDGCFLRTPECSLKIDRKSLKKLLWHTINNIFDYTS